MSTTLLLEDYVLWPEASKLHFAQVNNHASAATLEFASSLILTECAPMPNSIFAVDSSNTIALFKFGKLQGAQLLHSKQIPKRIDLQNLRATTTVVRNEKYLEVVLLTSAYQLIGLTFNLATSKFHSSEQIYYLSRDFPLFSTIASAPSLQMWAIESSAEAPELVNLAFACAAREPGLTHVFRAALDKGETGSQASITIASDVVTVPSMPWSKYALVSVSTGNALVWQSTSSVLNGMLLEADGKVSGVYAAGQPGMRILDFKKYAKKSYLAVLAMDSVGRSIVEIVELGIGKQGLRGFPKMDVQLQSHFPSFLEQESSIKNVGLQGRDSTIALLNLRASSDVEPTILDFGSSFRKGAESEKITIAGRTLWLDSPLGRPGDEYSMLALQHTQAPSYSGPARKSWFLVPQLVSKWSSSDDGELFLICQKAVFSVEISEDSLSFKKLLSVEASPLAHLQAIVKEGSQAWVAVKEKGSLIVEEGVKADLMTIDRSSIIHLLKDSDERWVQEKVIELEGVQGDFVALHFWKGLLVVTTTSAFSLYCPETAKMIAIKQEIGAASSWVQICKHSELQETLKSDSIMAYLYKTDIEVCSQLNPEGYFKEDIIRVRFFDSLLLAISNIGALYAFKICLEDSSDSFDNTTSSIPSLTASCSSLCSTLFFPKFEPVSRTDMALLDTKATADIKIQVQLWSKNLFHEKTLTISSAFSADLMKMTYAAKWAADQ